MIIFLQSQFLEVYKNLIRMKRNAINITPSYTFHQKDLLQLKPILETKSYY